MVPVGVLSEFAFFKDFSTDQLNRLATLATEENYQAGIQLYEKGDAARYLSLVREGKVFLFMENIIWAGKPPTQVVIDVITNGEPMGWSAVVEPFLYTVSARCIDDTKLINFESLELWKMMVEDSDLGFKIMQSVVKVISSRLTHTRIVLVGERGLTSLTEYK